MEIDPIADRETAWRLQEQSTLIFGQAHLPTRSLANKLCNFASPGGSITYVEQAVSTKLPSLFVPVYALTLFLHVFFVLLSLFFLVPSVFFLAVVVDFLVGGGKAATTVDWNHQPERVPLQSLTHQ